MNKLNLKRLRYLFPVLLAAYCLYCGITATAAIERSRATIERTASALQRVHDAAELVSELRFGSAELLASRASGLSEDWRKRQADLDALSRDKVYGGANFRQQILRTSALFDSALKAAGEPAVRAQIMAKELGQDAPMVWAGWRQVENGVTRRLAVDLAGPSDQSGSVAMLSAIACFVCVMLLWQSWHAGQLQDDTILVEAKLREADARSRAMAERTREILIQAEPSGRILRSNKKLSAAEMPSLFHKPDAWEQVLAELTQGRDQPLARQVWLAGSEEGQLAEWRAFPVRDGGGKLIRVDSALLDVTAWHAAQQANQTRISDLEQKRDKLQRQLRDLLDQSFELAESRVSVQRTAEARMDSLLNWGRRVGQPLEDAVAVTARLRHNPGPLHPEETEALIEAVDSVAASLRALSDFVGLERGPLDLSPAAFSPRTLVEDVVESLDERAETRHLEMPYFVHQDVPPHVVADAARLRQVLTLVVEHAIGHTGCGEVSVRLALASRAGDAANLRFEVEDSGAGFTREDLAAAFEPFHPRLPSQEAASGLAFAKRLVERLGGQIGAESAPGQGTRIWFVVPTEIAAADPNLDREDLTAELAGRRLLILDDSASQRGSLMELAQTLGLEVSACASWESILSLVRAAAAEGSPIDYVLTDFEMPGTAGPKLAIALREESPAGAGPAVFLVVPRSLRASLDEPCLDGLRGAISKPVRLDALARLLTGRTPAQANPTSVPPAAAPDSSGIPPARAAARKETMMMTPAGSPIVLIVEDNPVNQRVAARLVEKMGYRTAVVNNGLEAIQAFQRLSYDLILMDCQMPEVDGFTATMEIRRLESPGSRIPIIAMTANAMRGDREKCLAAGMDDYISKPVAYEDLRLLVTRWLARAEVARH